MFFCIFEFVLRTKLAESSSSLCFLCALKILFQYNSLSKNEDISSAVKNRFWKIVLVVSCQRLLRTCGQNQVIPNDTSSPSLLQGIEPVMFPPY